MLDEIIQLKGEEEGPKSIILAGVHGNERCGVDALQTLLPTLKIDRGIVWFVYGNPRAIEKNIRYTEANLNRMFKPDNELSDADKKSYEYQRAQFLKQYLDKSDILLDLHASFTLGAKPFVLCEPNAIEIAKYLPFDLMVTGFDSVEPGGTDYYMNKVGKVGICAECGYLGNQESTERAKNSILSFLKTRGHIEGKITANKLSYIRMYQLYVTKADKFTLAKPFKDFDKISKNQVIGIDGRNKVVAQRDGVILFARNVKRIGDEAFLLGEYVKGPR